jgi:hypothetical protein
MDWSTLIDWTFPPCVGRLAPCKVPDFFTSFPIVLESGRLVVPGQLSKEEIAERNFVVS